MFFKKEKEKSSRERLKENIQEGLRCMTESAEFFNNIIKDEEQEQYSKHKAAAIVVMLDSCLRLSLIEDVNPAVVASGMLMNFVDRLEIFEKNMKQLEEQDEMLKEGKNIVTDIPKSIH